MPLTPLCESFCRNFASELLARLADHAEQYDRASKALREELLAAQVEESLLEHVQEVALVSWHRRARESPPS